MPTFMSNSVSFNFYPVGQGLFSAGSIKLRGANKPAFVWVYDCGTSSGITLLDKRIDEFKNEYGARGKIDLLVLSHFDRDHINGVCRLLDKFRVEILMLPYMTLAQRLIIALEEGNNGGVDAEIIEFYLNPVRYLTDRYNIGSILYVPPSGEEELSPTSGDDFPRPDMGESSSNISEEFTVNVDYDLNFRDKDDDIVPQNEPSKVPKKYLRRGGRITLNMDIWEFVPYNDNPYNNDQEYVIPDDFKITVEKLASVLLSKDKNEGHTEALIKLKECYDNHFGKSSEKRNVISLFMFSGPLSRRWVDFFEGHWRSRYTHDRTRWFGRTVREVGILYSGDGYLNSNDRVQRLTNYLGAGRMGRITIFQVMHHGAESSWCPEVTDEIKPLVSIFSSDPEHTGYRHPSPLVLRDFWRYGAVQVDKDFGFEATLGNLF